VVLVLQQGHQPRINLVMVELVHNHLLLVQRRIMPVELVVVLTRLVNMRMVGLVVVGMVHRVPVTVMGQRVEQIQEGGGDHQNRVARESS